MGLLTLFAACDLAGTRAAMQRSHDIRRREQGRLRWETDGGATSGGPQPPGAQI
jgi:hypothetical protein